MTALSDVMLGHLEARGLDPEVLTQLGFESQHGPGGGAEALLIPYVREGRVVRRKYRTFGSDKRFWQDKSDLRCAWNEDALRDNALLAEPVLITEGELDAVAAIQSGHIRTISVPDGAPPPGERDLEQLAQSAKYAWLQAVKPLLAHSHVPHFVLAVDGDENGAALLHDLGLLLGRTRCKFVTYPLAKDPAARGRTRLKDLNEVLEDYGEAGVRRVLERAEWLASDGVFSMSELPPLPPQRVYEAPGFALFADHFKLRLGDFSVWTGIPSFGKTSFANDLFCRIATAHGLRIAWASFEQAPQRDHKRALRAWFHEVPEDRQTPSELAEADAWIDTHHRFIVPKDDDDLTLDWLFDKAEKAVVQHGCKILVIDPWNELDHLRARDESLTEYVGRAIKRLKHFAKAMQVHLAVIAHPTKQAKDENGRYRMPTLYDISDSAHWYNKCDLGVIVHRPNADDVTIKVQKSRYHEVIGKPGSVTMQFRRETRRFVEIERGEQIAVGS
jgi:twinkle protein